MTKLNEKTLEFLRDNNFKLVVYEDQGLAFYRLDIKDKKSIEKLIMHYYDFDANEEIDTDEVSFVLEIQVNGQTPQWTFTGGFEMFDILETEEAFIEYVKQIQEVIS